MLFNNDPCRIEQTWLFSYHHMTCLERLRLFLSLSGVWGLALNSFVWHWQQQPPLNIFRSIIETRLLTGKYWVSSLINDWSLDLFQFYVEQRNINYSLWKANFSTGWNKTQHNSQSCFSKPAFFFLCCCLMNLDLIDEEEASKKTENGMIYWNAKWDWQHYQHFNWHKKNPQFPLISRCWYCCYLYEGITPLCFVK